LKAKIIIKKKFGIKKPIIIRHKNTIERERRERVSTHIINTFRAPVVFKDSCAVNV